MCIFETYYCTMSFQAIKILILFILIFFAELSGGILEASPGFLPHQEEKDSSIYIVDKTDLITVRFYPLFKTNSLELKLSGENLSMKPHGTTNLGVGFNYKFLGLGISVGLPTSDESNKIFGRTKRFDFQASYYGKKFAADGFFQNYKGYYVENPTTIMAWEEPYYPQTEDLRVFSIGGTVFYIFNSETFSYKAAYLRNEIQKKSAGSFTAGIFAFRDELTSYDGFIPDEFPDSIKNEIDIKAFDASSIGIAGGYMHTFVIRGNFFINLALVPGIGYRRFKVVDLDNNSLYLNTPGIQLQTKIAMGYEFKQFYLGLISATILRNFKHEDSEMNLGTGQFRLVIGKRFNVSRGK